ncbi:hypothetical protein [Paenibacillus sp. DMB5]|uniref:hypothetical protein n=1 Tax=Paenibacillus sp. DMB5 TaxID=1780103 RepID=UPI00076D8908|nr:hypothetical protein [Paenibacillus sp. DMB5]KUP22424.1 hypothetical protein AWJ19_27805 [Paenibacillus sp. DMB5]
MKKFVSGIIVGVLLFAGVTAFANSSSLIGQKVQGLFSIEKGGSKIADAVIINGSAYAPVRAVAEAVGTNLAVEGKKIIMSDNQPAATSSTPGTGEAISKEYLEYKIRAAESEIESAKGAIKGMEDSKERVNKYPADYPTEQQRLDALAKIDEMIKAKQQVIVEKEKELTELKAQLTELSTP